LCIHDGLVDSRKDDFVECLFFLVRSFL
jgi:hypothetical protein